MVRNYKYSIGDKVKWNDPGINDFSPEEREPQYNRVYIIVNINGEIITIKDEYGEAEVFTNELNLANYDGTRIDR